MHRWTIAGMLGLVALLAIAMAAVRDSDGEWAEIAPAAAGGAILIAVALATLRRGKCPACVAFALFGGAYFLASWPIGIAPRAIPVVSAVVERLLLGVSHQSDPEPPLTDRSMPRAEYLKKSRSERRRLDVNQSNANYRIIRWDDRQAKRMMFGRKIAHSWLALAIGGVSAFFAGLLLGGPPRRERGAKVALREVGPIRETDGEVRSVEPSLPVPTQPPYRSLWGALKDLGPAPSAEEIDEARREACADFPREEFFH